MVENPTWRTNSQSGRRLLNLLPHDSAAWLIDTIECCEPGTRAIGTKTFLPDDWVFNGHFPNHPIVPGHFLIEALAQLSGVVLIAAADAKDEAHRQAYLGEVRTLRFFSPVGPNDCVELYSEKIAAFGSAARFAVWAQVNGAKVVAGEITLGAIRGGSTN